MIYFHKIIPAIFSPLVILVAFALFGATTSRRKLAYASIAALYLLSTPIVSNQIFRLIEGPAFKQDINTLPTADAIVVLSGMLVGVKSANGIAYEWSDPDRFFAGVELFKLSKSPLLVFTGGKLPWLSQMEPEGTFLKKFAESMGIPSDSILVTDEVQNTEDEARAVKRLLTKSEPTVLLVTSAFHMPRSERLFKSQGFQVTPYRVDFRVENLDITPMDFLPDARSLALTSLALRELIGRMFYFVKVGLNPVQDAP